MTAPFGGVAALDNLRTLRDKGVLRLPVGDEVFVIPKASARVAAQLRVYALTLENASRQAMTAAESGAAVTAQQTGVPSGAAMFRMAMGDSYIDEDREVQSPLFDRLTEIADEDEIDVVGTTAFFWQTGRIAFAVAYWQSGGKAPEPTAKKATPRRSARSTSTRSAAASTTRKRASGSATSSRRKSAKS